MFQSSISGLDVDVLKTFSRIRQMGLAFFLAGVAVTSGTLFTIIVCLYLGVEGTHHHTEHT